MELQAELDDCDEVLYDSCCTELDVLGNMMLLHHCSYWHDRRHWFGRNTNRVRFDGEGVALTVKNGVS